MIGFMFGSRLHIPCIVSKDLDTSLVCRPQFVFRRRKGGGVGVVRG